MAQESPVNSWVECCYPGRDLQRLVSVAGRAFAVPIGRELDTAGQFGVGRGHIDTLGIKAFLGHLEELCTDDTIATLGRVDLETALEEDR